MLRMTAAIAPLLLCAGAATAQQQVDPKVLVVTMFGGEAAPWLENLDLSQEVTVPGLPEDFPALHCNDDVCVMTTAMGFANAASSLSAVVYGDAVDLTDSYVLIAGIAGVDPEHGTLGSAHWARFVADAGLRHQIDPREVPEDWDTGSIPLGASEPGSDAGWTAGTELFVLNATLANRAAEISKDVELMDSQTAGDYRSAYDQEAAQRAPFVSVCDTVSGDTYWHGEMIAEDVEATMERLSGGEGTYCTTQMEDNATLTALSRGAKAGLVDMSRVVVLRTGSNFDRSAPDQTAAESLAAESGGYGPATENAYRVGNALVEEIVSNWDAWSDGVPE
ncbi:Purine nucleoside permease [Tranquillimonas rosea]|uniref:Purine nucleoside permease n=1 Tax=Tranquillimonas rosea TaxID=641238 RepID=A0A1H9PW66_9RHOB|nr:purine nucleoside permease [Tranquillimonas rosea]SER52065.1 Purine nucleoside permease [Tranquillimonas rosea]